MGPGLTYVAGLVPDVADKLGDAPPPIPIESEQARFRLFDAIVTLLKNTAAEQHLLLVMDDLHWADEPSLLLIESWPAR